jgi:DNA-binding transcriptional LysR family regulator
VGTFGGMSANGWMRLELRYLAALEAIKATGSFGGAAEELGYTQSAISHQIAALERLVGQPLIDRPGGRRPVGLTPAGSLLLGHAQPVLARMRIAHTQLGALAEEGARTVRVGTFQSVGVRILPGAAARLAESHPDLHLEIHERPDAIALVELVRQGTVDVAFCALPLPEGPFTSEELLDDHYLLLVPADSPFRGTGVPLEALGGLPLVGCGRCTAVERVESYLRGLGVDLNYVTHASDNAIIQAMVAEGRAALMTELSIDHDDPRTAAVPLGDWLPPRRVGLAWHRDQGSPPALQAFVRAVRGAVMSWRSGLRSAA